MHFKELLDSLFKQGLGDLLVLHIVTKTVCLGNISYNKGRLVIKDKGYLTDVKSTQLIPCWDEGIMGMVCNSSDQMWESLTFYGRAQCNLPEDLSSTRHGAFMMAQNEYGDNLLEFIGSIYRGFQLMLDNHYLPVVLLNQVDSKSGETGLAVCDLRAAPLDLSIIRNINNTVRESIENRLLIGVDDLQMNSDEFDKLFKNYMTNK